jgi:hypothetical protein
MNQTSKEKWNTLTISTMCPEAERFPLAPPIGVSGGVGVRPFGLSVARWDAYARFDRDKVRVDPDTQIGMVGHLPLREVMGELTTICQMESDGQTVISLDYPLDDE